MYNYKVLIKRVIDGDTVIGMVDLGFGVSTEQRLRLGRINAPELSSGAGRVSYEALKGKIEGTTVMIDTVKDKRDVYGRYIANITTLQGVDINAWLLSEGYAQLWTK